MSYTTRPSLLKRLREGKEIAWDEFYAYYAPYVKRIGISLHLTETETDDLIQQTMLSVFTQGSVLKYDASLGRFRSFLKTIITRKAMDLFRKKRPEQEFTDEHEFSADQINDVYQVESRKYMLKLLLAELKEIVSPQNYEIFYFTEMQEHTPEEAADNFEIPVSRIYTVRKRCLEHLRKIAAEYSDITGDIL